MTRHRSRLPLRLEILEDRTLLSAANVFAAFDGIVQNSSDIEHVNLALTQQNFTLNASHAVQLGFHVGAPTGSTLDPATVVVHNASGAVVTPTYSVANLPGSTDSVVLATLPLGNYTLDLSGEHGTSGAYHLEVFLPGDANGDRQDTLADGQLIRNILAPDRQPELFGGGRRQPRRRH